MRRNDRKPHFKGQGALVILAVKGGLLLWAFLTAQDKTKAVRMEFGGPPWT